MTWMIDSIELGSRKADFDLNAFLKVTKISAPSCSSCR